MSTESILTDALASLKRVQEFDAKSLARRSELGTQLSFEEIVAAAQKSIDLFKRVPTSILNDLVDAQLNTIKSQADAEFNRFKQVLDFSADQANANQARTTLISQIINAYDNNFQTLWQFIAYGIASITDAGAMEGRARAVLQDIEDKANAATSDMQEKATEADQILKNIQAVAAEQGVSQQAEYFKKRADDHAKQAKWWRNATAIALAVTILFALLSALAYKIPWLHIGSQYDAIEFITGKIFVLITLGGLIALCAKNFLAHQHNVVLNRHRQTALQTYRVLVASGSSAGSQDIVLAYAAACIFGNQDTGFSKESTDSGANKSVLELMTKSVVGTTAVK